MWVDMIIAVIFAFAVIQGFRHGFVHTFIHTIGWILAGLLGFICYPYVISFLKDKTNFYDLIHTRIADKIGESADSATSSLLENIPNVIKEILQKALETATDTITTSLANGISDILFNIIGFLVIVLAIKLFLFIITLLFSKKSNDGLVGWFDGFFGIIAGGLKGIILIYVLLFLLVPLSSLMDLEFIMEQVNRSAIGNFLYNNNLLVKLFDNEWSIF